MVFDYAAPMPNGWQSAAQKMEYHDRNFGDRIGWREIVVRPLDGVTLTGSDVPGTDVSNQLLAYPEDGLSNPLNVTTAAFDVTAAAPGTTGGTSTPLTSALSSPQARATRGNPDSTLAHFANLIAKDKLSLDVIILALLAAIGFGALHALSPGHGKTIVGAYLVGSRGTWRHALLLALVVTATHTSTVYALGFITLYLSSFIVPEKLYPWLSIGSGAIVLLMGMSLLVTRLRSSRLLGDTLSWFRRSLTATPSARLAFEHGGIRQAHAAQEDGREAATDHFHNQDESPALTHSHGFGPAHRHAPIDAEGRALTWRGLIGLGIFGGLLPCPSAIVVMLSAIALHRVAFGLLLIVAFSFGLAGVLSSVGLLMVYAGALSSKLPFARAFSSRLGNGFGGLAVRVFPAASAAAVVIAGFVLTTHGLALQGLL
jgi:ABC-type nickel/cobalt efflux system permease component RcnA